MVCASRDHLDAAGESYGEHRRFAMRVGVQMVAAGLACCVHALVPALYPDKASRTIRRLSATIAAREQAETLLADGGTAIGLLVLALVSAAAALLPWLAGAQPAIAAPLSLLCLAMPIAALVGEAVGRPDSSSASGHPLQTPPRGLGLGAGERV